MGKKNIDWQNLGFDYMVTDQRFVSNYKDGKWDDGEITTDANITLNECAGVLQYAQTIFEGLKAYRTEDGRIVTFRPDLNAQRMVDSAKRLEMPPFPVDKFVEAVEQVVAANADFVPPYGSGASLYIRPFIIATDAFLGVHASHSYIFAIILSPVGSYYANGMDPVKIYIEREYVRCVKGGTGMAKAGGNYAASLIGQEKADKMGYAQVLWLDGVERKYIDEVGAMNVFFVIDGTVITPTLEDGNILPGVTRASCIEVLKANGYKVEERKLSIDEVKEAHAKGLLTESFGTGTAAVISPVGEYIDGDEHLVINDSKIGPVAQFLYDELTGIQWGKKEDKNGWIVKVN